MTGFKWYRPAGDGSADVFDDCPAICARIDKEHGANWYGTPEGAILHGGVVASAFTVKRECLYDAAAWLRDGSMVPAGERRKVTITAQREAQQ